MCATTANNRSRLLQGEMWEVAAVPFADVRRRCAEVYSFCDLLVSQCMTDQPVAFRQMMCTVRAVKSGGHRAVCPPTPSPRSSIRPQADLGLSRINIHTDVNVHPKKGPCRVSFACHAVHA